MLGENQNPKPAIRQNSEQQSLRSDVESSQKREWNRERSAHVSKPFLDPIGNLLEPHAYNICEVHNPPNT